ncbi:MAG: leucyl/phenylalanyl-tRNA--protein transferase [Maritimibacter sp.]
MKAVELSPGLLLRAYAAGIFPMAERRNDPEVFWVDPERRGIMPLDGFHLSRSLKRSLLKTPFRLSLDEDFSGVVTACAGREETWINPPIFKAYQELHKQGHAHSIEAWEGDTLAGGVYGVVLGSAFFGESMFSHRTNASKIALATLVAHLGRTGFTLFDTQFLTDHLASLGAVEIARAGYQALLKDALAEQPGAIQSRPLPDAHSVVQWVTQTSNRA